MNEAYFIVDFKSLFNTRFPSSLQTCQLRFQVQQLGVNFAKKFASTFHCLNYCKQMFIAQVEINNSMESSCSSERNCLRSCFKFPRAENRELTTIF